METEQKELFKRRFGKAKGARMNLDNEIREVFRYIAPTRIWDNIDTDSKHADRTAIYDTTAMTSLNTLVTSVLANFVPMGTQWVRLVQSAKVLAQTGGESVQEQMRLQAQTEVFFRHINKSNFYSAIANAVEELAMVGTINVGVEWMKEEQKVNYLIVPYHEAFILDDGYGDVGTKFRVLDLPLNTIVNLYPKPIEAFDSDMLEQAKRNPDEKAQVIEVCTKLDKPKRKDRPHAYYVFLNRKESWTLLRENFTRKPRMITARWSRVVGSPWGDCPGRKALPDLKSINAMSRAYLLGSEYRATPPLQTQDENYRDKKLKPGVTYFAEAEINPINFGDPQTAWSDIVAMREQIKRGFMDFSLPPVADSKDMTAREVITRQTEFFRSLGHTAVNLEEELLRPLVDSTVDCLQQAGVMEDIPLGNDEDSDLEFNSVVRAGQNQDSISRDLTVLAQVANFGEIVQRKIDLESWIESVLLRGGFAAQFIKSSERLADEDADAQQQAMNAQVAQGLTSIIGQGKNPAIQGLVSNTLGLPQGQPTKSVM